MYFLRCGICKKNYNNEMVYIECREDVKNISKELINLKTAICNNTQIKKILKTLTNLKYLNCSNTQIKFIPKELINLKILEIQNTQIKFIPETLIKLEKLGCSNTQIKFIPEILKKLKWLWCDYNILVSPQICTKELNNKYYLTFVRCQARYRNKLRLRKLKFAYDPKYIIGHTTKKQIMKLFNKLKG